MPKITLTFDLPVEEEEFEDACQGGGYHAVITSFDNYLRNKLKYQELPEKVAEALQAARNELWGIADDYGVELD